MEKALAENRQCRLAAMPFSATAFLALDLQAELTRTVVVVCDSMHSLDELRRNLLALAGAHPERILHYPAWESLPSDKAAGQKEVEAVGERLQALGWLLTGREPVVMATCVQALMQMALSPSALKSNTFRVAIAEEHDPTALLQRLEQAGYIFESEVLFKGQASWRGGILDVWSLNQNYPFRIEFFGSTVETIRSFDPANQRSFTRLKEAILPPVGEWRLLRIGAEMRTLVLSYLPPDPIFIWSEPVAGEFQPAAGKAVGICRHAAIYREALAEAGIKDLTVPFAEVYRAISKNQRAWQCLPDPMFDIGDGPEPDSAAVTEALPPLPGCASRSGNPLAQEVHPGGPGLFKDQEPDRDWPPPAERVDLGFRAMAENAAPRRDLLEPDVFAERRRQWLASLAERARHGLRVHLFFYTQGALDRFHEMCPEPAFHLHVGMLSDGFMQADLQLAVLSESNLLGRPKLLPDRYERVPRTSRAPRRPVGETITDWTCLEPGDLVVHVDHGIGRYLGLYEIEFQGKRQEALTIEYADKAKLYVPVSQAHLLTRYIGVGKHAPNVHRLGGARWSREKAAAEHAVRDLAASLLEIQAMRESMTGIAFPPDTPWQNEFEASFPYQETEDQERAIAETKHDMEAGRPMDRLVCGDVGYGKTEVAMRAAFKCVMNGKQVAVLTPTTVLAQQHYEVFAERMAAYPVRVELLCRFRTRQEQAAVVRALATGGVDIVIGTHRLIQPDVRFKDLGLVVIDEEQRFGVANKERFKHLQQLVDVLTLTATPIPRTLYMSLTGAKEISMIQTSPKARQPIETIVTRNDDNIVRDAILREINRGGQVYFLHNRVMTIERVRQRLRSLVPEARIVVGHGQMPTADLAHIMRSFARGDYDLLLCTTIIESGLDIPNVNTIIIDRADRFGMADLYQLRGRVGRASRKAYAYMLLPVHGRLLDAPRRRIQAILEHTELGAGFRLAMRDLEIRGAGNLLGSEQSGHISAIGFDLYCQLLRYTVAHLSQKDAAAGAPRQSALAKGGLATMPTRVVNVEVNLDFIDLSTQGAEASRSAFLPMDYVEDERLRINVYRQIASALTLEEITGLREEFQDRFGPLPQPLDRLLKIASLRIIAAEKKITMVEAKESKVILHRQDEVMQIDRRFPRLRAEGADAKLEEMLHWLRRAEDKGFSI